MKTLFGQLSSFAVIGVVATLTHTAAGLIYHNVFGIEPFYANLFAFFTAMWVTIIGNARITFRADLSVARVLRALFGLTFTLALHQGTVVLIVDVLGFSYEIALVALLGLIPAANFLMLKFWAFRG